MNIVTPTIQCQTCDYSGKVLIAHYGYKWWMLPIGFLIAATGVGAVGLGIVLIFLGNRTFHACPKCKGRQLAGWSGETSPENEVIWSQAKAADDMAFKTNKLILFGIVMMMFVAALVFVYMMQGR